MEIHIDLPLGNYNLSRFDWTGKITNVTFKGNHISGTEIPNATHTQFCGRGFYNEFGIDSPLGFDETKVGDWFHKIGIGLLKKEKDAYNFFEAHEIIPAEFEVSVASNHIYMTCTSRLVNGYAYLLEKEIRLLENGFEIVYTLKNEGSKSIITNEYNHNFLSINQELIGEDYVLTFPFQIKPTLFEEHVNPGGHVKIGLEHIGFNSTPEKDFFFSKVSGGESVQAKWSLENIKHKMGISETGNFESDGINVWGGKHVISPELFFSIDIKPRQTETWTRTYHMFEM